MICCLPTSPWNVSVSRIDWMISLSLRSAVRCGSWTSAGSSSRARTSCWVIVDAPRLSPRMRAQAGRQDRDRIEARVVPEGLVLDRGRGVEQDLGDLVEGHDLALGLAEACQLDLAGPVVHDRLFRQHVVRSGSTGESSPDASEVYTPTAAMARTAPTPARNRKRMTAIQPTVVGRVRMARSGRACWTADMKRQGLRDWAGARGLRMPQMRRTRHCDPHARRIGRAAAGVETHGVAGCVTAGWPGRPARGRLGSAQPIRPAPSTASTAKTRGTRPVIAW